MSLFLHYLGWLLTVSIIFTAICLIPISFYFFYIYIKLLFYLRTYSSEVKSNIENSESSFKRIWDVVTLQWLFTDIKEEDEIIKRNKTKLKKLTKLMYRIVALIGILIILLLITAGTAS